jgi:hypothetical protein
MNNKISSFQEISGAFKITPKLGAKRMHDFIKPNKIKGFRGARYSTPVLSLWGVFRSLCFVHCTQLGVRRGA